MKKLQGKGRTAALWTAAAATAAAIVLMALPIGAVLTFAAGPQEWIERCYSYFDIGVLGMSGNGFLFLLSFSPVGYGISALLAATSVLLFLSI